MLYMHIEGSSQSINFYHTAAAVLFMQDNNVPRERFNKLDQGYLGMLDLFK